jgi:hypothetical protein
MLGVIQSADLRLLGEANRHRIRSRAVHLRRARKSPGPPSRRGLWWGSSTTMPTS